MTSKETKFYSKLSIKELEKELEIANSARAEIIKNLGNGELSEEYARKLYFEEDKKHQRLYYLLEKKRAEQQGKLIKLLLKNEGGSHETDRNNKKSR